LTCCLRRRAANSPHIAATTLQKFLMGAPIRTSDRGVTVLATQFVDRVI
jgi:hypothetical protein